MNKLFVTRFVTSILVLLIASSFSHTYAQGGVVSDEDEADIVEWLIENEIKPFGSEFRPSRNFSSENIGPVAVARIEKLGYSARTASDIESVKRDYLIDYVVIRSMSLKDGMVVVRLSEVTEGRPCFAPAFSTERSFTFVFKKSGNAWVGGLLKRPAPFTFTKSLAFPR